MIDIKSEFNKYRIDVKSRSFIVGVSGGPDSMCLLHLLMSCNCEIIVCHINYGLREKNSDKDEELVKEFCSKNDIKCYVLRYYGKKHDENTLRNFRYAFFRKIGKTIIPSDSALIAIAHNSNDQAETILMNFIRGASLKGLGGMKFLSEDIVRPLLSVSRDEILKYLKKHDIPYRIDQTNKNDIFFRNRIRNELVPILKKYNPNVLNTINNNSDIFRDLQQFIGDYSDLLLASMAVTQKNSIEIDYKKWILSPKAIKMEVLKRAIMKIMGNLRDLQAIQLKEVVEMLTNKTPSGKKTLLKNLSIEEKYDKIVIVIEEH